MYFVGNLSDSYIVENDFAPWGQSREWELKGVLNSPTSAVKFLATFWIW
jgi:hypothetical protein